VELRGSAALELFFRVGTLPNTHPHLLPISSSFPSPANCQLGLILSVHRYPSAPAVAAVPNLSGSGYAPFASPLIVFLPSPCTLHCTSVDPKAMQRRRRSGAQERGGTSGDYNSTLYPFVTDSGDVPPPPTLLLDGEVQYVVSTDSHAHADCLHDSTTPDRLI
jgi:hypothetical protein